MADEKTRAENCAIARARWEGEPRCSYSDLTDFLEISKQAIAKRAKKDGWTKKVNMQVIADKAHALADQKIACEAAQAAKEGGQVDAQVMPFAAADRSNPAASAVPTLILNSKNAKPEMLAAAVEDVAVDARAEILKRHRNEWPAVRNQVYKALKSQDNEGAKLAKLAAESLKLLQDGERKAWGIDTGESDKVKIVIERQEGVRVVQ